MAAMPALGRSETRAGLPPLVAIAAAFGAALFVLPVAALLARVSWRALVADLTAAETLTALRLSVVCSLAATGLSLAIGVPLAWVQSVSRGAWRTLLRTLTMMPIVLPPVVGGVALLAAFGRRGVVGAPLDAWLGTRLPFTTAAAVLAETFVAMPFLVLTVEAALRGVDPALADAA